MKAPRSNSRKGQPTILEEAIEVTGGDRQRDYGHPKDNHGRTALLWSAYLGVQLDAADVCALNILQKLSRHKSGAPKRDTVVDVAGYAGNMARCLGIDP